MRKIATSIGGVAGRGSSRRSGLRRGPSTRRSGGVLSARAGRQGSSRRSGGTLRTLLKGRRRYALLLLVGVGSLAIMGAQCQPEPVKPQPPTTEPPAPPSGGNFTATLDGLQAVPPVQTQGSGSGMVTLDASETTLTVSFTFSGLSGNTLNARIQGPAAAGTTGPIVMTLPSFPAGVTSGDYDQSFAFPAGAGQQTSRPVCSTSTSQLRLVQPARSEDRSSPRLSSARNRERREAGGPGPPASP